MAGYVLVDNTSYDVSGVYYGGWNKKYSDVFNITIKHCAKVFESTKDAQLVADNLNSGGYAFVVEPM